MPIIKTYEANEASPRPNATVPYTFLLLIHILLIKGGCVIIDYGHLWCTLLLYIV